MNNMTPAAAALLLTAALVLTACGGEDATSTSEGGRNTSSNLSQTAQASNDADVAFAQGMIPHHTQAIEMAQLAPERAANAEVKQLASAILAAQGPEIDQLETWLDEWGAEMPSTSDGADHDDMGHGDSESSEMSGMMSEDDVAMLEAASGAEFDQMFLEMMTIHHRGAVSMAKTEVAEGEHADAIAMASQIITTQAAEIKQMQDLLNS